MQCILDIKTEIAHQKSCNVSQIRLVWHGILLEDGRSIQSYDLPDYSTLYCSIARRPSRFARPASRQGVPAGGWIGILQGRGMERDVEAICLDAEGFLDRARASPAFDQYLRANPRLAHMLQDSDGIQEQMNLFSSKNGARHAALLLDSCLTMADRMPKRMNQLSDQFESFEDSIHDMLMAECTSVIPTVLPPTPDGPSEEPLADEVLIDFYHMCTEFDSDDEISQVLAELNGLGVHLTELPGMTSLRRFVKEPPSPVRTDLADRLREMFPVQLRQLEDMGFTDFEENVKALVQCQGNVGGAIMMMMDPAMYGSSD
jgi:hypothetical protein